MVMDASIERGWRAMVMDASIGGDLNDLGFEGSAPILKLGIRFLKLRARPRTPQTGLGMASTGFWSFPPRNMLFYRGIWFQRRGSAGPMLAIHPFGAGLKASNSGNQAFRLRGRLRVLSRDHLAQL